MDAREAGGALSCENAPLEKAVAAIATTRVVLEITSLSFLEGCVGRRTSADGWVVGRARSPRLQCHVGRLWPKAPRQLEIRRYPTNGCKASRMNAVPERKFELRSEVLQRRDHLVVGGK
jgi:hypothetical protein